MTVTTGVPVESPIARYEQSVIDRIADFQDPRQEWRRLFAEVLGTFFLVLVAAGGGMTGHASPNTITRTDAVVAPALMVLGVILAMGKISGAHLNPAVTSRSRCAATSNGAGCPATSSRSSPAQRSPHWSCTPSSTCRPPTDRTIPRRRTPPAQRSGWS